MSALIDHHALLLSLASVVIVAWSIARARSQWRFDRLALRGFDLPFEPAGPFRQSEPSLRPMYGFVRDPGCQIFFVLHLLATFVGIASLATTLWFAVAVLEGMSHAAGAVAALAGLFAAILAVPMWLGHRLLHGLLSGLMALFVFALWSPAVPLLLVIVVIQHDLIRRRAIADELEQRRREDHERKRSASSPTSAATAAS